jgi:SAM-dependent methyltransferase
MDDNQGIDLLEVRRKYNRLDRIWAADDPWHMRVSRRYDQEIHVFLDEYNNKDRTIVNIGSGDKVYTTNAFLINIDISEKFLGIHSNPICASANALPLKAGASDAVICIGSVINYCDAIEVISEISRILKPGGKALVEFESSESFEYYGSAHFGKISTIVNTKYGNADERIWLYKPSYIKEIASAVDMQILSTVRIHTLTSIVYRIIKNERISSAFCVFDRVVARTPIAKYSANAIFVCQRL